MEETIDKYLDNLDICSNCPGSMWGKKSICRIHEKSIGQIDSCPEWQQQESPGLKEHDGQLAWFDLEPAMEVVEKVWEDLHSYQWMVREINRLLHKIEEIENKGMATGFSTKLVAQYGIEASLPKAKGAKIIEPLSDTDMKRLEKMRNRVDKYKQKVDRIDQAIEKITDERERTILECILDGVQMKAIALHVGISRQALNEIKRKLIKILAWEIYREELQNG